jgi:outer membrane protein OmpA-like peptidoglycan-associated protein
MRQFIGITLLLLIALPLTLRAQEEKDIEGGKDHPLLTRMPGFYIDKYEVKDFDSFQSAYLEGKAGLWEGKISRLGYHRKSDAKPVSMVQIARNYENAIRKLGGKTLYNEGRVIGGMIQKGKSVTWVEVAAFNEGVGYELTIVESKAMEQEVEADASALSQSIAATGKVALYGIYFDTGKSVVKPESNPTLEQIAKLLVQEPKLLLYVVGHTDNVGALEMNLKLSSDRADAVVKALTGRGVAATRLKPFGAGPMSPVESNRTEEGRAKNRRVELVEHN